MKKRNVYPYLFVLPALIFAGLFTLYPAASAFVSSFLTVSSSGKVLGFADFGNYWLLFRDPSFINALGNTLVFVALFVPANTFLTVLAASLTRRPSRFSFLPEYVFFLPMAISLSSWSILFREIFKGRSSVASRILGISYGWITEKGGAMVTLVILGLFLDFGLDYILLLAAFRSSDRSVIEAARIDGATGKRLFFSIELPMVKETVLVTVFLALKDAILISAPVMILTEGGPFRSTETVMFYYYTEAFRSGNRAVQNALSALILVLSFVLLFLYGKRRTYDK